VKRVLFDENMPRKLRRDLPEFHIRTAQEQGWSAYKNGQLIKQLSEVFDVLVTIDQNIRHQQNLSQFNVGVVAIEIPDTRLVFLRQLIPEIREAISVVKPGELINIERPNSR
jgi:hypothetical protein